MTYLPASPNRIRGHGSTGMRENSGQRQGVGAGHGAATGGIGGMRQAQAGAPDGIGAGSNPHMHGSRRSALHVVARCAARRPRDVGALDPVAAARSR